MSIERMTVVLERPPAGADADVLAVVRLPADEGADIRTLTSPLIDRERDALTWYVEHYWKWPYEGFAQRGHAVEQLLADIGQRLYQVILGRTGTDAERLEEIAIVSELPAALSLPWELLHDGREFLALRSPSGVAITRAAAPPPAAAVPLATASPVRVLLVTSRPEGTPFIDQRLVARPIVDRLQDRVDDGHIALEFLRPPTLETLHDRLSRDPEIHILHFDGHGIFRPGHGPHDGEGLLAFETDDGRAEFVEASILAKVLRHRSVQLAVLTACQSGIADPEDAFTSVAGQLVRSGIEAVVAMSGSVLTATAALYVDAFYEALAAYHDPVSAHRHAQNVLARNSRRHLHQRRHDEVGTAVELKDWWVPQLFTQTGITEIGAHSSMPLDLTRRVVPEGSDRLRGSFVGRARELRTIERALLQGRIVVLHGLAGSGKSALAREAANWLTRTGMYARPCFVSFENGGTAASLLSAIAFQLDARDGLFDPSDTTAAIERLRIAVRDRPTVLIADNLESILAAGDAPLDDALRSELFGAILAVAAMPGTGVLCTTRDPDLGDDRFAARRAVHSLSVGGLHPEDAYELASSTLAALGIPRATIPYADLRDLLARLDHHPLAIQLTVPALAHAPIADVQTELDNLLSASASNDARASDASPRAALRRFVQRLAPSQQKLLTRFSVFQGGASEIMLAEILQVEADDWRGLADALESAGLLVREQMHVRLTDGYWRFHPVFVPFIRGTYGVAGPDLARRYVASYTSLADYLYAHRFEDPERLIALEGYELPNMLRALDLAIDSRSEVATLVFDCLQDALVRRGMGRRLEQLRQQLSRSSSAAPENADGGVSQEEYLRETTRGEHDLDSGHVEAAIERFASLLERMESVRPPAPRGKGSMEHTQTVANLARARFAAGDLDETERLLREAWAAASRLLEEQPDDRLRRHEHATLLMDIGALHRQRGHYDDATAAYESALVGYKCIDDVAGQAATLVNLAGLDYPAQRVVDARRRAAEARALFERMADRSGLAVVLNTFGDLALEAGDYAEAEGHYRSSLAIAEERQNPEGMAKSATALSLVARMTDRQEEAEGWLHYVLRSAGVPLSRRYAALANLALLVIEGVRAGRFAAVRLAEARAAARRALRIQEQLDDRSSIWKTLNALASIAELRGQQEIADCYRKREREAYADVLGHRERLLTTSSEFIGGLVRFMHDERLRATIVAPFSKSDHGRLLAEAIERIAAGERDWHSVTSGLSAETALLVRLILEAMAGPPDDAADTPAIAPDPAD